MNKNKRLYFLIGFLLWVSLPLQAWDCCEPLDMTAEARVAYYHPSSHRVRRIYNNGWVDYQLELSKGLGCNWRVWTGVSGFSRKGDSIGFHDRTRLQLIPISLGAKYFYALGYGAKVYVGGAACYSFLRIHDHDDYVRQHIHKQNWGGDLSNQG